MNNPTPGRAPEKSDALATFNRITRDASTVAEALDRAQAIGHLVSPATSCADLPEGTSVALSAVLVDVAKETYEIPGSCKRGLGKTALDRIALAAGISWDPQQSRRLDDGRDPHYCAYLAVGTYRQFDGSTCTILGEKELDMREKSPVVETLWMRHRQKLAEWEQGGKRGYAPKSPDGQIGEVRVHLLSHCASKAKLRAIRGLGIRTGYTAEELQKPFVIAKLTFTGETTDPELRREFALMRAQSFFGARQALYGAAPSAPQLPPCRPAPLVGTVVDEDGVIEGEIVEEPAQARSTTAATPAAPPAPPASPAPVSSAAGSAPQGEPTQTPATPAARPEASPALQTPAAARAAASGFAIPGGRSKGKPLEEADDQDLTYWGGRLEQELADGTGKPQFRDRNEALARAIRAEQGRRAGVDEGDDVREGVDFEPEGFARGDEDDSTPF
jgi:hypothetical protein